MKVVCVGGGPAGLYFAISAKLRDPRHDITVIERDPRGATYGWGVVYWDDLLDMLFWNDPVSARAVRAASVVWKEERVIVGGQKPVYLPSYGFSLERAALLRILADRASELGVDVQHCKEVVDPSTLPAADLVVVADGASSRLRRQHRDHFGTRVGVGGNPYIWLGTTKVFDTFTFAFEKTPAGWIWFHSYPSSSAISTCIVECSRRTWKALGFDTLGIDDSLRLLEKTFERVLDGGSLLGISRGRPVPWLGFSQVMNRTWHHGNMVLIGDAAHTTHFSIGSGTKLAMIDAVMLVDILHAHERLSDGLAEFDRGGRAALAAMQARARESMAWFESADSHLDAEDPVRFGYTMVTRGAAVSPWGYRLFVANQVPAIRAVFRGFASLRRGSLAWRRAAFAAVGATIARLRGSGRRSLPAHEETPVKELGPMAPRAEGSGHS